MASVALQCGQLRFLRRAFEEKRYPDLQDYAQALQPARANAVRPILVLLKLLKCYSGPSPSK
jgi:hypothetical protein